MKEKKRKRTKRKRGKRGKREKRGGRKKENRSDMEGGGFRGVEERGYSGG